MTTGGTGGAAATGGGGTGGVTAGAGGVATGGTGGVAMGGTGGLPNPCEPWPMTTACLTIEEIEMRIAMAGQSNEGARPILPTAGAAGAIGTGGVGTGGIGAGGIGTGGIGAGGMAGSASAGSAGMAGSSGMAGGGPEDPSDCPELPANSRVFQCVDPIGGPATSVQGGRCCWTCRMVCG
jgi:hypothetical protein